MGLPISRTAEARHSEMVCAGDASGITVADYGLLGIGF